jgi:predicted Zn finger-like uncharacterized protein
MRLTCPTCGAIYEPPEGLLPSAGGHVQCSACHTRWFFRPARPAPAMTEDQILERLETRHPDLTLVQDAPDAASNALRPGTAADADPPPPEDAVAGDTAEAAPTRQRRRLDLTGQEPAEVAAAPSPGAGPVPAAAAASGPASPLRPVARAAVPLPEDEGPRPMHRVEIGAERGADGGAEGGSRFALGLALAVLVGAGALGVYSFAGPLAERMPAAAPALEAYAGQVTGLRERIEASLGLLRDRLTDG